MGNVSLEQIPVPDHSAWSYGIVETPAGLGWCHGFELQLLVLQIWDLCLSLWLLS